MWKKAIEILIKIFGDNELLIRLRGAYPFWKVDSPEDVEVLIELLGDEDLYVRRGAAEALGKAANPRAVEPLIKALEDRDQGVRVRTMEALNEICPQITTVIFGESKIDENGKILNNPDVSGLTVSMKGINKIIIDIENCKRKLVEKFIEYATKHIDTEYMKKNVSVYVYGNLGKIDANMRNSLNNIFKNVIEARR